MAGKAWSEEEIDILREWYPIEGRACHTRLNNRTESALIGKAYTLGLKYILNRWGEKELDILKEFYPIEGTKCKSRLTGRTTSTIINKACSLKLNSPRAWTPKELNILSTWYSIEGISIIKRLNNRTIDAIHCKASSLKIPMNTFDNARYDSCIQDRSITRIGNYESSRTPIEHLCLDCGNKWFATPNNTITNITGCPKCNKGFYANQSITIYLLSIICKDEAFLKVGLSSKYLRRIREIKSEANALDIHVVHTIEDRAEVLVPLEHKILRLSGLKQHHPRTKFGGYTECLHIDEEYNILKLMKKNP